MNQSFIARIFLACAAGFAISASAQKAALPADVNLCNPMPQVPTPMYLAGNFAELRANHFHSGIDIKTQGKTGFAVHAVDSGYVSRVLVSPWGFGRAVYITHPKTGLTTVYGHLEAFSSKIDNIVRAKQYERETFSIDLNFKPGQIPVERDEIIARSGNAGSSGGPHLHLDVRETSSGHALDPLPYFKSLFVDKAAPEVRKVALFAVKGRGTVTSARILQPISAPYTFTAWGDVYPGITAYDRMTSTSNIYGIKYMTLTVDGKEVYNRNLNRADLEGNRAIHTLVEYPERATSGAWIMTTRIAETKPLLYMVKAENEGIISIKEERDYACVFTLTDEFGNTTKVPFTIKGKKSEITAASAKGKLVSPTKPFNYENNGVKVSMPVGSLYDTMDFTAKSEASATYLSAIHTIGDIRTPIGESITISIKVDRDTIADKAKYCLVRIDGKSRSAVTATYKNGWMTAKVNRFGKYAVTTDTTAPTVQLVSKTGGTIVYRISDNLSGIDTYKGLIDGKFALFELDGKTARATFKVDTKRFKSGNHSVTFTAIDACGNKTTKNDNFSD
jgi:hypothetical protein